MTNKTPFVIGVDGGGTSTKCACVGLDGALLSTHETGPSNYLRVGLAEALENVRGAVESAVRAAELELPASAAGFCLSGVGRWHDRSLVVPRLEAFGFAERTIVDVDAEAALAGAHAMAPGVVMIAGTGAIAYGRNHAGARARGDGWGPILGDEGSAYWIGVQVLRTVMRAYDGRGEPTALTAAVLERLAVEDEGKLVTRLPLDKTNSSEIAQLAALCSSVREQGDPAAQAILERAGEKLAESALAAVTRLDLRDRASIAVTGSVFRDRVVLASFERALKRELPTARVTDPRFPASIGAALIALDALGVKVDAGLLAKLSETSRDAASHSGGQP